MFARILTLMRVRQYYKNLVIFLPLIFSGTLFDFNSIILTFVGFLCLCLVSSSNYVLNDIVDRKADRLNPEKKTRPLASGSIGVGFAVVLMLVSLSAGLAISNTLGVGFFISVFLLFISSTFYSLRLKDEPFLDINIISVNFVIRAVSGAFILGVFVSPWLILCPFFLALFLALAKRRSEIKLLGKRAQLHRKVLKFYSDKTTETLMMISTTLLIISYSLYCFLSVQKSTLLVTLPFMMYVVFRFIFLSESKPKIARYPEKMLMDVKSVLTVIIWGILLVAIIYL